MRLWSIHPQYLDRAGLTRLWNESLTAARALVALERGEKRGYQRHPQLERFKACPKPVQAISDYMHAIADEAQRRGLRYEKAFQREYIPLPRKGTRLPVTAGQMEFEIWHYGSILVKRRGNVYAYCKFWSTPQHSPHPMFLIVTGAVEEWERLHPVDYTKCEMCGNPVYDEYRGKARKRCTECRKLRKRAADREESYVM